MEKAFCQPYQTRPTLASLGVAPGDPYHVHAVVTCGRCGYAGLPASCGEQPGGPGAWRGCGAHVCPACWNHEPAEHVFYVAQPFWAGDLTFT